MPYDLLSKVGLPSGILILLAFFMYKWIETNKQIHDDHKAFVNEVICKCDKRENELMSHIEKQDIHAEKQDENMNRITNTLEKMDTRLSNIEYKVKGS